MTSHLNLDDAKLAEAVQGITSLVTSPLILFASETIQQPVVRSAICEGLVLSERAKEAVARIQETLDDLSAEAKARLVAEPPTARAWVREGESEVAVTIQQIAATFDEQIGRMTNGMADLRLLVPVGLGALALRQLLVKGLEIDEMPWYTLAWYAFDTFLKLNSQPEVPPTLYPTSRSEVSHSESLN